jgi:hypothetical protein
VSSSFVISIPFFQGFDFTTTAISHLTHLPLLNAPKDISKCTNPSMSGGITFLTGEIGEFFVFL